MCVLDERARSSSSTHSFIRKERVERMPSCVGPPADGPKWALKGNREQQGRRATPTRNVNESESGQGHGTRRRLDSPSDSASDHD